MEKAVKKQAGGIPASPSRRTGSVTRKLRQNAVVARDEKAQRLLEATEKLLASGYSFIELSVDQLCREAGIGRSTYYVYFKDKSDLIRALAANVSDDMIHGSRAWLSVAPQATRGQFDQAILDTFKTYRRHKAVFKCLAETSSYDPSINEAFSNLLGAYSHQSVEALKAGKALGTIRPEVDESTLLALVWMFERIAYRMLQDDDSEEALHQASMMATSIAWPVLYNQR